MTLALKFDLDGKQAGFVIVKEDVFYGNSDILRNEMVKQISDLLPSEFLFVTIPSDQRCLLDGFKRCNLKGIGMVFDNNIGKASVSYLSRHR